MHAVEYFTVADRGEIMRTAQEYAYYNTDREENPSGDYHGQMTIHDDIICESYDDAVETIDRLDRGFYDDHAVRYKDKDALKPTKQMEALKAKGDKLIGDRIAYAKAHQPQARKSEFAGCKKCGSKISLKYLNGNKCPVCRNDLRPEYVLERLKKYDADLEATQKKYAELKKKQTGKCPIRWAFKVEVHC